MPLTEPTLKTSAQVAKTFSAEACEWASLESQLPSSIGEQKMTRPRYINQEIGILLQRKFGPYCISAGYTSTNRPQE